MSDSEEDYDYDLEDSFEKMYNEYIDNPPVEDPEDLIDLPVCPKCKVSIKNYLELNLKTMYNCGNEECKSGFFLIKEPDDVFYF